MSIRKKFSFAIVVIFLLNIVLLLGFYKSYIYPQNTLQLEQVQKEIEKTIVSNVENVNDRAKVIAVFNEKFENNNLRKYSAENLIESVLTFEMAIMCLILILASTVVYINFVKPIEVLSKEMDNYSKGITLKEFKNRKDEIGRLHKDFLKLVNKVEDEKLKQNNIVASISHDIKTPLTSIMGYSERLLKKNLSAEKQKVYLSTIYSKSQIINELINDFDEYLNYSYDKQLLLKHYQINEVYDILNSEYTYELQDMGIDFKVINNSTNRTIAIDLIKFKRVIGNIISNSLKFTSGKDRNIKIQIDEVYTGESKDQVIRFTISDNGTGVDESIIDSIFDPLFTTDNSRKVAGLGLAICKNIIMAHEGEIMAQNAKNGGLEIKIFLKPYK